MQCQRCGYCCINYDVVILIDPDLGAVPGNVEHKATGVRCRHLLGNQPGNYACAIHAHPNYASTPCADFTQIEQGDSPCRMGVYVLKQIKEKSCV